MPYTSYHLQPTTRRRRVQQSRPAYGAYAAWFVFLIVCAILVRLTWGPVASIFATRPPQPAFEAGKLEPQLQHIADAYPSFNTSVVLTDVATNTTASINATTPFRAASTTKLITAIDYLHQIEQGKHSLTEMIGDFSTQDQLQMLINQSNNDSWSLLRQNLGDNQEQAYARSLGLTSYQESANSINAFDLATLLTKLIQGSLLNSADTHLLLSWMQNTYEEDLIPPVVPGSMSVYHKAGTLEDDIHDAALIKYGSRWYVLVIMSNGNGNQDYAPREDMFRKLTQTAVNTMLK